MDGVEVLPFVPAEPRKEVPGAWFSGAVAGADRTVFWEVQAVLLMLILLFTFARSESPLAKSHTGAGTRVSPGEQTQGPVAAPPNAPPPHSVGQRRREPRTLHGTEQQG